jgi:hypothetical protein
VDIKNKKGNKGRLSIDYYSLDDIEQILERLGYKNGEEDF